MIYVIGIALTFFLDFLLISKKNKSFADKILAAWLFVTGVHLTLFYLYFTSNSYQFPFLLGIEMPLPLLHGPFLYLYTVFATNQNSAKKGLYFLHFLPPFALYLYLIPFFLLPAETKISVFKNQGMGYESLIQIVIFLISLSGVIYIVLSLIVLKKHRQSILNQFSYIEKINFNWLKYLIYGMGILWVVILLGFSDTILFTAVTGYIFFLGYFGIKQVGVFTNLTPYLNTNIAENKLFLLDTTVLNDENIPIETPVKYLKSGLSKEISNEIHIALTAVMNNENFFKDAELSLASLANHLNVQPNYLSQVINQMEGKNFYDYINALRIEEFKKLVAQPNSQKYTLLALAYECGFNSKTSFNRHFKKLTGQSPSEFTDQLIILPIIS